MLRPLPKSLGVVTCIHSSFLVDVDHAAAGSILCVILPPTGTEFARLHHEDLLKLVLELCSAAITHIRCDYRARVLIMRNRTIVLTMECSSHLSLLSAIVESWVSARFLVHSLGGVPLFGSRSTERESRGVVLVLLRLCCVVAVLFDGAILRGQHLLLPATDITSLVVTTLLVVVAVTEWRSWRTVRSPVILLASVWSVSLIAAQNGTVAVRVLTAAGIAWVGHAV